MSRDRCTPSPFRRGDGWRSQPHQPRPAEEDPRRGRAECATVTCGQADSRWVLSPHAAIGPEEGFSAIAPGRIATRVARFDRRSGCWHRKVSDGPARLGALTALPFLDDAAVSLAVDSIDFIGYASTSSAYAIGFDNEAAMVSRLTRRTGIPVAATCASAVLALRVFGVERIGLVDPPWFDDKLNELGVAYFRGQGLHVVSLASASLSRDPRQIDRCRVRGDIAARGDDAEAIFIGGNGFSGGVRDRGAGNCDRAPGSHVESSAALEPACTDGHHVRDLRIRPAVRGWMTSTNIVRATEDAR
jgi:maleate isomerase